MSSLLSAEKEEFLADFFVQGFSVKCVFNYEFSSNHAFRQYFPYLPFCFL